MDALTFRRAKRDDLPRLLALLADDELGKNREAVGATDPVYSAAFDVIDRDNNQLLLVGEQNGEVIAMLQLTFIPGLSRRGAWRANIEAVRVASQLRGRGIGARLMEEAHQIARKRGCRLAQLTSDQQRPDAHRFYEQLGYTPSHIGFKLVLQTTPGPQTLGPQTLGPQTLGPQTLGPTTPAPPTSETP
jgi:GNAT superfamily N-acetyltransferase